LFEVVASLRGSLGCEADEVCWLRVLFFLRGRLGWKTRGERQSDVDLESCGALVLGGGKVATWGMWLCMTSFRSTGWELLICWIDIADPEVLSSLRGCLGPLTVVGALCLRLIARLDCVQACWFRWETSTMLIRCRMTLNERLLSVWQFSETEAGLLFSLEGTVIIDWTESFDFRGDGVMVDSSLSSRDLSKLSICRISVISLMIEGSVIVTEQEKSIGKDQGWVARPMKRNR